MKTKFITLALVGVCAAVTFAVQSTTTAQTGGGTTTTGNGTTTTDVHTSQNGGSASGSATASSSGSAHSQAGGTAAAGGSISTSAGGRQSQFNSNSNKMYYMEISKSSVNNSMTDTTRMYNDMIHVMNDQDALVYAGDNPRSNSWVAIFRAVNFEAAQGFVVQGHYNANGVRLCEWNTLTVVKGTPNPR